MNKKFYISTKEDKVGTVFAVAEYADEEFKQVMVSKVSSNNIQAYEDIVDMLIEKDEGSSLLSFKFKSLETSLIFGNKFDKDEKYKKIRNDKHSSLFSSPCVFSKDASRIHRADSSLESYLILREHYHLKGKI